MSCACKKVSASVLFGKWATHPTLHGIIQDFERFLGLVAELV